MAVEEVKAVITENEEKGIERMEVSVEYDFGETLEDMVDQFGDEICFGKLKQKFRIDLQAFLRTKLLAGATDEEIQEAVENWKPGAVKPKKSKKEKILDIYHSLPEEERVEFLKSLKG